MKNTRHSCFFCEFSVCPMSSVCREGRPQYFQRKNQSIYPCFLIQLHGCTTQMLSNHPSWMLESIFFFNTRHTAQGRNTARGVPAFSDRLFGKRNPRNLPLKLPSMAGIIFHSTNALPRARQASSAASSGASQQVTLSHTRFSPASPQSFSQLRIHSPSPQP